MKLLQKMPLFILIVVSILGLSITGILTDKNIFPNSEEKQISDFPVFDTDEFLDGTLNSDYEKYFSDQFFLKNYWNTAKSISDTALLKTENNGVVFGKDGYLFSKFYKFNPDVLRVNLSAIDNFSAAANAPVSVMVVPSKYHPLIDNVPGGLPLVDQNFYISEIYNYLSENSTVINAKDLLAVKNQNYIYYRTDPRWTNYGAWCAYSQFAAVAGFTPFDYNSREILVADNFLGVSYYRSNVLNPRSDQIEYYNFSITSLIKDKNTTSEEQFTGLYDLEQFEKQDKYAAFLQGNSGYTVIETIHNDTKLDSILVIKDSFANCLIPMLTEHYNTIHIVDPRFYSGGYKIFTESDYDDVLILLSFENLASNTLISNLHLKIDE